MPFALLLLLHRACAGLSLSLFSFVCGDLTPPCYGRGHALKVYTNPGYGQRAVTTRVLKGPLCAGVHEMDKEMECNSREKCDCAPEMRFVLPARYNLLRILRSLLPHPNKFTRE